MSDNKVLYNSPTNLRFDTFAGADIVAAITVPVLTQDPFNGNSRYSVAPTVIGNIQTLTISTHREKFPVRALKSLNPKGFTRGPRTIGGTFIFAQFDKESLIEVQHKVRQFYKNVHQNYAAGSGNIPIPEYLPHFLTDELPPFDVTITMANEYGNYARMAITGIEVIDTGQNMGVNELYIEQTMSYMARDFYPLEPYSPVAYSSKHHR